MMPKPEFHNINDKIATIIRVNHAGEFGARAIYEGQLKYIRNPVYLSLISSMLEQEKKHLDYFSTYLIKHNVRPSALLPFWQIGGYFLGNVSSFLGSRVAMLVTQAVEEVIEKHYQEQLDYLNEIGEEKELFLNIKKFQDDEIEHKNIAIKHESEKAYLARILFKIIKNICLISIGLSKRI